MSSAVLVKWLRMKTQLEWVELKTGCSEVEMAIPEPPLRQGWNRKTGEREDGEGFSGWKMLGEEKRKKMDDAKGGVDTYGSKVLEQARGNGTRDKNGGAASKGSRNLPFTDRGGGRLRVGADQGRL